MICTNVRDAHIEMTTTELFDIEEARKYWQFAPSGRGKVNTLELLGREDGEFYATWLDHYNARLVHYWEERRVMPYFAAMFNGKDVLSFGSGIGLNEMQFVRAGARLVCADIVDSNLRVIERVAAIEGTPLAGTLLMEDSARQHFGGPYDVIYAYGSLMTMPIEKQRQVMSNFKRSLKPDGCIILMLYTWKFVVDTCGFDSPKQFALCSDPSVNGLNNPWSDWHDDEKLIDVAGREFAIAKRQLWNQGWYVWYMLEWAANHIGSPTEFISLSRSDAIGKAVYKAELDAFEPLSATIKPGRAGDLYIETGVNNYLYAAWSPAIREPVSGDLEIYVDYEIHKGAFSVGILDVSRNQFVASRALQSEGRQFCLVALGRGTLPSAFRLVLSNFKDGAAASSSFTIHEIAIVEARGASQI